MDDHLELVAQVGRERWTLEEGALVRPQVEHRADVERVHQVAGVEDALGERPEVDVRLLTRTMEAELEEGPVVRVEERARLDDRRRVRHRGRQRVLERQEARVRDRRGADPEILEEVSPVHVSRSSSWSMRSRIASHFVRPLPWAAFASGAPS